MDQFVVPPTYSSPSNKIGDIIDTRLFYSSCRRVVKQSVGANAITGDSTVGDLR